MNEKKLFLLIEGKNEIKIKQAKIEVQRLLDDEVLKSGLNDRGGGGGGVVSNRYSVL